MRTALNLNRKLKNNKNVRLTLIDKLDAQTFQPALYEVASVYGVNHEHPYHTKLRGTICLPYGEIFKGTAVNFIQAEVNQIDSAGKFISTTSGQIIDFDYLVIALGAVVSTFGVPGVQEYAFKFKSIEDGLMLADKLEELFTEKNREGNGLPLRIIVGGAGFTGVELAAELATCSVHIARRTGINHRHCAKITLLEAGPMILPMVSNRERKLIRARLNSLGVDVLESSPIVNVGPNFIDLKDNSKMGADLIIWSAGVKALDLFKSVDGLALDERDRIMVDLTLQIKNFKNIFAVGDAVFFVNPENNQPVPQMAIVAMEQGRVVAENIAELIQHGESINGLKKYIPKYGDWVTPVGGKYAVAHIGGWTISGFLGYVLRQAIDIRYLLGTLPFFKALGLFLSNIKVFSTND